MTDKELVERIDASRAFQVAYAERLREIPVGATVADVLHRAYGLAIADAVQRDPELREAIARWFWCAVREIHGA